MGAGGGEQTHTLTTTELAAHNHGVTDPGHTHSIQGNGLTPNIGGGGSAWAFPSANPGFGTGSSGYGNTQSGTTGISIQNAGGGGAHNNVPPAQVAGIWVIKT